MIATPRSLLFVSGEQPARFAKAVASNADVVCIDLEDAVAPAAKRRARDDALAFAHGDWRPGTSSAIPVPAGRSTISPRGPLIHSLLLVG